MALVFSNWRSIPKYRDRDKMQVAQSRADMLRNELNNMMELAQEMFHFAHQSAPRVHQLEQAWGLGREVRSYAVALQGVAGANGGAAVHGVAAAHWIFAARRAAHDRHSSWGRRSPWRRRSP